MPNDQRNDRRTLARLTKKREAVHAQIDALYWAFTRQARAKPPVVVRPDLYERRKALDERIADLRRRGRK